MTNYEGVILGESLFTCIRKKQVSKVEIINVFHFEAIRNSNTHPVTIIELLPGFRDSNDEYGARRQTNSFEGILPFGDGQAPPRKTPLENSWKRIRN